MRRLVLPLLITALAAPAGILPAQSPIISSDGSLSGTREIGFFVAGRVLSTDYSVSDGRSAVGGAISASTHLSRYFAVQGGLGIAYSSQAKTYYKPPLFTFTPTLSLVLQGSTANQFQPYVVAGAGYEFVRFIRPRCDCEQSKSIGIANVGGGVRKMIGDRRAFRIEATSQMGSGQPAFSVAMGMSLFIGGPMHIVKSAPRPPDRVRTEPPVPISTPVTPRTVPIQTTPAPQPPPQTPPQQTPARVIPQTVPAAPAPNLAGTVLLTIDGTQVDFNKTTWRDDAEPLLDGLAVDLTSDAGEKIKISIEAYTDNIGSRAGNIALGLDRAKAVREFLINQGISADRIAVSSAGGDNPIAPNTTALGRQRNRRIVVRRTN
jgi:outer membrane protein OmpA-like peptidoglycan-associated protein